MLFPNNPNNLITHNQLLGTLQCWRIVRTQTQHGENCIDIYIYSTSRHVDYPKILRLVSSKKKKTYVLETYVLFHMTYLT